MDNKIKQAVEQYENYQRLQKVFSLEFVVNCLTNPRRGDARIIGEILKKQVPTPTLLINGIHYHELVELEEFRRLGYSDDQLGDNHSQDSNYQLADTQAKRKELEFYQAVAESAVGLKPPFLSWVFSVLAPSKDLGMPMPTFEIMVRGKESRGPDFYKDSFNMQDVKNCISLWKMGGNPCSGESIALSYAQDYLSGRRAQRELTVLDLL